MSKLSIIIPVYFSADTLMDCYDDLKTGVLDIIDKSEDTYELIMVDDGSKDDSYKVMQEIAAKDKYVKCVKLSRNFGEHAALSAGLNECTGDCAVNKAADCQESPELIMDMFNSWKAGNKVVLAIRAERDEGFTQKLLANTFYSLVRRFVNKSMPKGGFDIFLIDRNVIEALQSMNEVNSAITLQILWAGFTVSFVPYTRHARTKGKSRWSLRKKINYFLDSFIGFSSIPIRFLSTVGILAFIASIIWAIALLVEYFTVGVAVQGWTMLACMILFATGLIMLSLAVISEYIWRILDASRGRPIYIIDKEKENN